MKTEMKIRLQQAGYACLLISSLQAQAEQHWSFETDKPELNATGFVSPVGEWRVLRRSNAYQGRQFYAQQASNPNTGFNLTLAKSTQYQDVDLAVSMKSISGDIDQGGGLVWRAKDKHNYYIARFNPLEDNYRVYKVENGSRRQLQSASIKKSPGWHQLRVTMQGDHIQCYYDGKLYLDTKDDTFSEAGMIGLWTKADAVSYFDELNVKPQTK